MRKEHQKRIIRILANRILQTLIGLLARSKSFRLIRTVPSIRRSAIQEMNRAWRSNRCQQVKPRSLKSSKRPRMWSVPHSWIEIRNWPWDWTWRPSWFPIPHKIHLMIQNLFWSRRIINSKTPIHRNMMVMWKVPRTLWGKNSTEVMRILFNHLKLIKFLQGIKDLFKELLSITEVISTQLIKLLANHRKMQLWANRILYLSFPKPNKIALWIAWVPHPQGQLVWHPHKKAS